MEKSVPAQQNKGPKSLFLEQKASAAKSSWVLLQHAYDGSFYTLIMNFFYVHKVSKRPLHVEQEVAIEEFEEIVLSALIESRKMATYCD